tara:strand:- start:441 stop:572 length:132 start_codon:yes stop_codon:yes gene_type:complete
MVAGEPKIFHNSNKLQGFSKGNEGTTDNASSGCKVDNVHIKYS